MTIIPNVDPDDATDYEAKKAMEGAIVVALPLLLSLTMPSLIYRAVVEKTEGVRMVINCAGIDPSYIVTSSFLVALFVNGFTCLLTMLAGVHFDVTFLVETGGGIVGVALFFWSLANSSLVVLGGSFFATTSSANFGGYVFAIVGSLVSTLISSVMFGMVSELILGSEAVLAAAPSPAVSVPFVVLLLWPQVPLARFFYVVNHACTTAPECPKSFGDVNELGACVAAMAMSSVGLFFVAVVLERRGRRQMKGEGDGTGAGGGGMGVSFVERMTRGKSDYTPVLAGDGEEEGGEGIELGNVNARDADSGAAILDVRNVSKVYNNDESTFALKNVSFQIKEGACVGLLGKNGAGKSTIQKLVAGHISLTSGEIVCASENIGVCRQNNSLWGALTCEQHLVFYCVALGARGGMVAEVLRGGGLWEKRGTRAQALSGGMRRRLCACIALFVARVSAEGGGAGLAMFDEPSSGLDLRNSMLLWRAIKGMMRGGGRIGVLITTHLGEEAEVLCTDTILLRRGRVLDGGGGRAGEALVRVVGREIGGGDGGEEVARVLGGAWVGRKMEVEVPGGGGGIRGGLETAEGCHRSGGGARLGDHGRRWTERGPEDRAGVGTGRLMLEIFVYN